MTKRIIKIATPSDVRKYVDLGYDSFSEVGPELLKDGFDLRGISIHHFLLHLVTNLGANGIGYHTGIYTPDRKINGAEFVKNATQLDNELNSSIGRYLEECPNSSMYIAIVDKIRKDSLERICAQQGLKYEEFERLE